MSVQILEYKAGMHIKGDDPFPETVDYLITVPCLNREEKLTYIFRSYCFESYLYITDYFPSMYEDDDQKFRRFTSHEGFSVNMRQISITCLAIFVKHFINKDIRKAMVISGSYQDNETPSGPSRKLNLYKYFFYPLLEEFQLRSVEMMEHNAFILTHRENPISDDDIMRCYLTFKSLKNGDL